MNLAIGLFIVFLMKGEYGIKTCHTKMHMKKLLSILLSVVMITSMMMFVGCEKEEDKEDKKERVEQQNKKEADEEVNPKEDIVGSWTADFNVGGMLGDEIGMSDEEAKYFDFSSLSFEIDFKFNDDGTYSTTLSEDSLDAAMNEMKDIMTDGMEKYLEAELGMTLEDYEAQAGMTLEDTMEQAISAELMNEAFDDINKEGKYELDEDKLYMSDSLDEDVDEEYETFEFINKDEIKIIEAVGSDAETIEGLYPITLKRK